MVIKMAALEHHRFESNCHFSGVFKVKTSDPTSDYVICNRAVFCKLQSDSNVSNYRGFLSFHFLLCICCFYNYVSDLPMLFQSGSGCTEYFMSLVIINVCYMM